MRNVSQLHPALQKKVVELQKECKKQGIKIKIGECFRTVSEQNALYAKEGQHREALLLMQKEIVMLQCINGELLLTFSWIWMLTKMERNQMMHLTMQLSYLTK